MPTRRGTTVTRRPAAARDERLSTPFIRAIGALSLARFELDALQPPAGSELDHNQEAWCEFARHLLSSADAIMRGATGSALHGNTIPIDRDGVQVAVDAEYVERLAEKTSRHARIGRALGIGELLGAEELSLTA
jgi:hypothetical protein